MNAHATINYKKLRLESLENQNLVKKQHEHIVRRENLCKKVAGFIKGEKKKKTAQEKAGEVYENLDLKGDVERKTKQVEKITADIENLKLSKKLDVKKF